MADITTSIHQTIWNDAASIIYKGRSLWRMLIHKESEKCTPHHHREEEVIWAQWREQRVKRPWEWRRGHPWSSDCMYSWKGNRYARTGRVSENRASSVFNEKRERERERERNRAFWKWTYFPQSWALSHLGGQCVEFFLSYPPFLPFFVYVWWVPFGSDTNTLF